MVDNDKNFIEKQIILKKAPKLDAIKPQHLKPSKNCFQLSEIIEIFKKSKQKRSADEVRKLIDFIKEIKFFRESKPKDIIDDEGEEQYFKECVDSMLYEHFQVGDIIFHYDERGSKFYYILAGKLSLYIPKSKDELEYEIEQAKIEHQQIDYVQQMRQLSQKEKDKKAEQQKDEQLLFMKNSKKLNYSKKGVVSFKRINTLHSGQYFGEMALILDKARTATIVASCDTDIISMNKVNYEKLLGSQIYSFQDKIAFYEKYFPNLQKAQLGNFCYQLKQYDLHHKEVLYHEGDKAAGFYILLSGEVRLYQKMDIFHDDLSLGCAENHFGFILKRQKCKKTPVLISIKSKGALFGEQEVFLRSKRQCTAVVSSIDGASLAFMSSKVLNHNKTLLPIAIQRLVDNMQLQKQFDDNHIKQIRTTKQIMTPLNPEKLHQAEFKLQSINMPKRHSSPAQNQNHAENIKVFWHKTIASKNDEANNIRKLTSFKLIGEDLISNRQISPIQQQIRMLQRNKKRFFYSPQPMPISKRKDYEQKYNSFYLKEQQQQNTQNQIQKQTQNQNQNQTTSNKNKQLKRGRKKSEKIVNVRGRSDDEDNEETETNKQRETKVKQIMNVLNRGMLNISNTVDDIHSFQNKQSEKNQVIKAIPIFLNESTKQFILKERSEEKRDREARDKMSCHPLEIKIRNYGKKVDLVQSKLIPSTVHTLEFLKPFQSFEIKHNPSQMQNQDKINQILGIGQFKYQQQQHMTFIQDNVADTQSINSNLGAI